MAPKRVIRGNRRERRKGAASEAERPKWILPEGLTEEEQLHRVFDFIHSFSYNGGRRGDRGGEAKPAPAPGGDVVRKRKLRAVAAPAAAAARKPRSSAPPPKVTTPTKKRKIQRRSQLTDAEKRSEAYRRVPRDHIFRPPPSCHHLLQEMHSFDPWRVLVICMLLNVTTGNQV